jgi:hypothetical protein
VCPLQQRLGPTWIAPFSQNGTRLGIEQQQRDWHTKAGGHQLLPLLHLLQQLGEMGFDLMHMNQMQDG